MRYRSGPKTGIVLSHPFRKNAERVGHPASSLGTGSINKEVCHPEQSEGSAVAFRSVSTANPSFESVFPTLFGGPVLWMDSGARSRLPAGFEIAVPQNTVGKNSFRIYSFAKNALAYSARRYSDSAFTISLGGLQCSN
jgi:hypothetical protein